MNGSSAEAAERLSRLWLVIALVGLALGLRLFQMQIIQGAEYRLAAERNRSQLIHQNAPRGRIYDRHGEALATNAPAFSLIFLPGKSRHRDDLTPLAAELSRQLGQDSAELLERLQEAVREESAVRLAENLPTPTMFRLSELKTVYPGVDLIVEARRYYPHGRFASHLLGYMGKMSPREWRERRSKGYRVDARTGKMGLERLFENELRGRDGGIRMEVDAQGRLKRMLEKIPWEAGSNVHLTLEAATQKAADEGLRASNTGRGAVVAVDPRNGDVLALSSAPDFDPNALLSSDPEEVKDATAALPEYNLAISGTYPPGSTFKPIVGLAVLNEGKASPEESVFCPGFYDGLAARTFLCWEHKGHKRVAWLQGLAKSCDVYFYTMGRRVGGAAIERYAKLFGLGRKVRLDLGGEKAGHMFGPETRKAAGKGWYEGDTLNQAIGQGELLVTPLQMAVATAALANRGSLWRPHYTQKIEYADGRPEFVVKPEKLGLIDAKPESWRLVDEAMQLVVSSGTGGAARVPGLTVAGKTGTAQNPHGDDHAWFIAYASKPGEEPSIAVAVLVEHGQHGSSAAVPIARKVILAHFGMPDPNAPKPRPAVPALLPAPGVPGLPGPARTL
ncbi:MAG: penicillin-binding protein 2 [Elusimicrobiota bacterium]|nr:penicillin-binding protein 2 [Elusimicrobiota bacterium]